MYHRLADPTGIKYQLTPIIRSALNQKIIPRKLINR